MQHHKLPPQLTLGLGLKDEATFDNFFPGTNLEIINSLKALTCGDGDRIIYICSARGHGLSHLLQACCHAAYQNQQSTCYLPLQQLVQQSSEVLNGFEHNQVVCMDDLHVIAGKPEWEEAVFHLFNRIYDAGGKMVIAARDLPKSLNLQLPDLLSRLSWGIVYQLHPLTDQEKLNVLVWRANRRGITLSEEVGKFILTHCPRHMGTLFAALDVLDKASLAAQRRLTIPFVKEILCI